MKILLLNSPYIIGYMRNARWRMAFRYKQVGVMKMIPYACMDEHMVFWGKHP